MLAKGKATERKAKSFSFAPKDAKISRARAETIGRRFVALAADGNVTPTQIVEDARPSSSPLHSEFEWDNRKAAEKHRLAHARWLIGAISIEITYEDDSRERTRAFHSVVINGGRGYAPMTRVMSSRNLTEQVLADALKELEGWQRRYGQYEALGDARVMI